MLGVVWMLGVLGMIRLLVLLLCAHALPPGRLPVRRSPDSGVARSTWTCRSRVDVGPDDTGDISRDAAQVGARGSVRSRTYPLRISRRRKEIEVSGFTLEEVVAARDAARGFSGLLERLRSREASRFVVFFRNRPQAVLLHVDEYERLIREAEQLPVPARS
jgi:hypothetical protein